MGMTMIITLPSRGRSGKAVRLAAVLMEMEMEMELSLETAYS